MIRDRVHGAASKATTRLEAFTDGVFAIAATLLVLDLTTHAFGEVHSDREMWAALGDTGGLFLNFALSFLLLCLLWMTHVQQFEHIVGVDSMMVWLNNLRLLFIVLVPFTTGLVTEYSDFVGGRILMPITFFFAILFGWLQWLWALRHREAMLADIDEIDARALGRGSLSALLISVVVVALSPWIGSFAFLLFLLDRLVTLLLTARLRRRT